MSKKFKVLPKDITLALLERALENANDTRSKRSLIEGAIKVIKRHWVVKPKS